MQTSWFNQFYSRMGFVLLSLLFLNGCGFHIKYHDGYTEKYPEIYLQSSSPKSDLTRFMKTRLRGAGIKMVNSPADTITTLKLGGESSSSRKISVYVTGESAEKEIGYKLNYSITTPGASEKQFTFNLYRDFLYDSNKALAKSRESELLKKEMRELAADHILSTLLSLDDTQNVSAENNADNSDKPSATSN